MRVQILDWILDRHYVVVLLLIDDVNKRRLR